jgi:hypothetical protein
MALVCEASSNVQPSGAALATIAADGHACAGLFSTITLTERLEVLGNQAHRPVTAPPERKDATRMGRFG